MYRDSAYEQHVYRKYLNDSLLAKSHKIVQMNYEAFETIGLSIIPPCYQGIRDAIETENLQNMHEQV